MYDIRIFLEDNGQFWAVATLGEEKIYAVWNTQQELLWELRKWIDLSWSHYSFLTLAMPVFIIIINVVFVSMVFIRKKQLWLKI